MRYQIAHVLLFLGLGWVTLRSRYRLARIVKAEERRRRAAAQAEAPLDARHHDDDGPNHPTLDPA